MRSIPADPDPTRLPSSVGLTAEALARLPGAVAVVLGGSQSVGTADRGSDWDLTVYYRDSIDLRGLEVFGSVHPPGSWGRIMNGGAWLRVADLKVDVLLRDLDVAARWTREAEAGSYEVDALLGYVAGVPTYSLAAELASGQTLSGTLPVVGPVPPKLVEIAPPRWRFARAFSLDHACMHAVRGDVVGAAAQVAKAAMEEAHARMCEQARWVLNEKRLLATAGLSGIAAHFTRIPTEVSPLTRTVESVARSLQE